MNEQTPSASADENQIIAERRAKLAALRAAGPAFPNDFVRELQAGELQARYGELDREALAQAGIEVVLAGRMMLKRVMGKASFATIQDRTALRGARQSLRWSRSRSPVPRRKPTKTTGFTGRKVLTPASLSGKEGVRSATRLTASSTSLRVMERGRGGRTVTWGQMSRKLGSQRRRIRFAIRLRFGARGDSLPLRAGCRACHDLDARIIGSSGAFPSRTWSHYETTPPNPLSGSRGLRFHRGRFPPQLRTGHVPGFREAHG